MKRSRPPNAYNSSLPNRSQRLARSGPITPKRRSASEYARVYHSKERVCFVKALPCLVCGRVPSDNAHTKIDGMGRKASYRTIVPLCRRDHRAFDEHRAPFALEASREMARAHADQIEAAWQHHQHPNPEHISGPLGRVLESIMERVDHLEQAGDDA